MVGDSHTAIDEQLVLDKGPFLTYALVRESES